MKIESLEDLFTHCIQDLHSAETQITKALPKLVKKARSPELKEALQNHLQETERQITRLETIARNCDFSPKGKKCKGMEGILEEGSESLSDVEDALVIDAAIIAASQVVEHYEIANYGTAKAFAEGLDHADAVELLEQTLEEEKNADSTLTELAEGGINAMAEAADSDDESESAGADGSSRRASGSRPRTGSR